MVQSLVDLCIKKWIDNVWSLGDVGEIDDYLLDKMLPICSVDQLKYVEGCTKVSQGRDLSSVTDKLWKKFYEARFDSSDVVIEKMRKHNVPFKWKKAYEYKEEEIKAQEQMRRLVLEEYANDDRGADYYRPSSMARPRSWASEETDFLNSDGEDYYYYNNNNNNNNDDDDYDDVEEEDDEIDVEEEFLERVGGGHGSVEDSEEEQTQTVEVEQVEEEEGDDDDDYHGHYYNNDEEEEEDEETNVEEEFLERVGGEVSVEELVEEQIQIEMEEEEQERDSSEVGQEEDSYGDDSHGNDYHDGYDNEFGCDDSYGDASYDGYGNDYGCDDGYGDDSGSDFGYY